jgi:hypothetical protein
LAHAWRFFRAGGFDQVRLDSGADIAALLELDPKLWLALSCPTKGLELDPHTLELLDTDKDGRVRVPEVLAAAKWACAMLKSADALVAGAGELPLDAINASSEEGAQLLASARQLLKNLGRPDAKTVTPADTADTVKIFAKTTFNGDGVIAPESAAGDALAEKALRDIIACQGPVKDLSGLDGVDRARVEAFFAAAGEFVEWWKKGELDPAIFPFKEATPAAYAAFVAVREKVDDYFTRCGLAAMDARAAVTLNPPDADYVALASKALPAQSPQVAGLPLARVEANGSLPLEAGVNPAWRAALGALREQCLKAVLGGDRTRLTLDEWNRVDKALAAHAAWEAKRPPGPVAALGSARLEELTSSDARAKIDALLAKDQALAPELSGITSVDRLVHYHRDLARFLNNFVAFADFYTRRGKAMFQAGTLYLDGRACDLCLRVDDAGKHASLAGLSMMYLAYCDLTRKGSAEKQQVVAAFTGGDAERLMVGRNGIFYDRKGQDWDATIVKVVEQPISVRQAFWEPYRRGARFISDQINSFASARSKESDTHVQGAVTSMAKADDKPAPFDVARFAGIFAAIGLAVGALGSALAAIATGFLGLKPWQMPLALAGAVLVISGPAMLLAAMKLRLRNLGPLLDASGWAINGHARINIPFGAALTHLAALPKGSTRALTDPYADKKRRWWLWVLLFLLVAAGVWAYRAGYLEGVPWLRH